MVAWMYELELISNSLEKIAVDEGSTALFKLHLALKGVIDNLKGNNHEDKSESESVQSS